MDLIMKNELMGLDKRPSVFLNLNESEINNAKETIIKREEEQNLILDFNDINKINDLLTVSSLLESNQAIKKQIYADYISSTLLTNLLKEGYQVKGRLQFISIQIIEENLSSSDLKTYLGSEHFDIYEIIHLINQLSKEASKRMVLHLFLDKVHEDDLQEVINYLMVHCNIKVMAYSPNKELITNRLPNGNELSENNYLAFEKEKTYIKQ